MSEHNIQISKDSITFLKSLIGKILNNLSVEVNNFNERQTKNFKSFNFVYMEIENKIYSLELWKGDVTPYWLEGSEDSGMTKFMFQEVPEIDDYYGVPVFVNKKLKDISIITDRVHIYDDKDLDETYAKDIAVIFKFEDFNIIFTAEKSWNELILIDIKDWKEDCTPLIDWKDEISDYYDEDEIIPFNIAVSKLSHSIQQENEYTCPVCGHKTFEHENDFNICPVCNWENDGVQEMNPDSTSGANHLSLNQARERFKLHSYIKTNINPHLETSEFIQAESEHFVIQHESELVWLRFKDSDRNIIIGDHYGDPMGSIIDKNEKWTCSFGEGLIVYFLKEPFDTFETMKIIEPQWIISGRDNPQKPIYVKEVIQTGNWEIEVVLDDEAGNFRLSIPQY